MRVIIAGGRDFHDRDVLLQAIESSGFEITEVVCGGAHGADEMGDEWAEHNKIPVRYFNADWKKYGHAAGPMRNAEMAKYAEALIALPGGRGTADMISRATALRLKVYIA